MGEVAGKAVRAVRSLNLGSACGPLESRLQAAFPGRFRLKPGLQQRISGLPFQSPPLAIPADSSVYADYAQYSFNAEGDACRCTEVSILYALKTCPKRLEWP